MPLTPEEVAKRQFQVVLGRGYDRSEVDQFLDRVAEDYSAAIQKIAIAASGGIASEDEIASEIGELLRGVRETANRIKNKAQAEADRIKADAESDARREFEQAEKQRAELLGEAETKAMQVVEDAEERARQLTESSLRQKSEAAARAQERYGSLLEHERELRERTEALETLVTEMRALMEPLEQIDLTDDDELSVEGRQSEEDGVSPVVRDLRKRLREAGPDQSGVKDRNSESAPPS
jgi:cell division initiation protein